jgi:hypothetical protein
MAGRYRPKVKLLSLADLDGRTNAAKSAHRLVADLENDLGGHDALSASLHELIKRTALLGALCEDLEVQWLKGTPIDTGNYALLTNAQRRYLTTIGISRTPRDITPDDDARERRERLFMEAMAQP